MHPAREFDPRAYWRDTVRRILLLLAVWLVAGPVLGILLVEPLNRYAVAGVPLGFWMAQQGSIYVFVLLIFVNAWLADRADRAFGVDETPETTQHTFAADH
jgi:putative solute:sodium symporter small subunit